MFFIPCHRTLGPAVLTLVTDLTNYLKFISETCRGLSERSVKVVTNVCNAGPWTDNFGIFVF